MATRRKKRCDAGKKRGPRKAFFLMSRTGDGRYILSGDAIYPSLAAAQMNGGAREAVLEVKLLALHKEEFITKVARPTGIQFAD